MDNNLSGNNDEHFSLHANETTQIRRNVGNKSTQTNARPCKCNDKKQVKSTATQTFLTKEIVAQLIAPACLVSIGTQTENISPLDEDNSHKLPPSDNTFNTPLGAPIDAADWTHMRSDCDDSESDCDNSKVEDENFEPEFENEDDTDEGESISSPKKTHKDKQRIVLSRDKLPHDQMKFVVFEESLVKCFERCFKCDSACFVYLRSTVGTFCRISVTCSGDIDHAFDLSTGPLNNRLPLFNLMLTSGILSSGLECAKVLRLFDSLNIPCIKRREFTDLQSAYVIPAVVNVWNREKTSLVHEIKGTSRCIASDMRVDSPGHSGLFGSGSSLDVEKNVILDTQIIKVLQALSCANLRTNLLVILFIQSSVIERKHFDRDNLMLFLHNIH